MADTTVDTGLGDTTVGETLTDSTSDTGTVTDSGVDSGIDTSDAGTDSIATDTISEVLLGCHVVINEVQTRSATTGFDEFIEIYNPCDTAASLTGWKLVYRSASGATETVLIPSFGATASVAAKGFLLVGNGAGAFAATSDATYSSGIGDDGGVALRDPTGTLIDSVAWGAVVATHPFIEKAAAAQPSSGASISRQPAGADTNDNGTDFKKTSPATPKAG